MEIKASHDILWEMRPVSWVVHPDNFIRGTDLNGKSFLPIHKLVLDSFPTKDANREDVRKWLRNVFDYQKHRGGLGESKMENYNPKSVIDRCNWSGSGLWFFGEKTLTWAKTQLCGVGFSESDAHLLYFIIITTLMLFIDKMPSRDDGDETGEAEMAALDESAWAEGRSQRYEKHGSRSERKKSNKTHADEHVWPRCKKGLQRGHNSSPRRTAVTWGIEESMYDGEAVEEDYRDIADKKNRRYQQYSSPSERTYSSYAPSIPGVRYVAAPQIVTVKPHAETYVSMTYRRHR